MNITDKLRKELAALEADAGFSEENSKEGADPDLAAYLRQLFLAHGTLRAPSDGGRDVYRLSFSFTDEKAADDTISLLAESGFAFKKQALSGRFYIYNKTAPDILDIVALMGAGSTVLDINLALAESEFRSNINRKNNFDFANISKTVDASGKIISNIARIKRARGLESLGAELKRTAEMRADNPELSLAELAEKLGISKSALNHRLRKITHIAETVKGGGK